MFIEPGDRGQRRGPDGKWIICCWDDCDRPAQMQFTRVFRTDPRTLYPFCSERHAELHSYAPRDQHQLPAGCQGLAVPK